MMRTRIAARGEHSARAANDPMPEARGETEHSFARGARTVIVSSSKVPLPWQREADSPRAGKEERAREKTRTFRTRSQISARVLRHAENIPRAQPMIRTRIAARGEHSARAANDPHAYCGTRRKERASSESHPCS